MQVAAELCPILRTLRALHARFEPMREGEVATYIPELARADPEWFGICLATADGYAYEVGDTRQPFTIQSISKPFVYGLALEDRGKAAVLARVGVEPTGDAFNEISLESGTGRPRNPMINAGAITATSLVAGHSLEDRWERILALFSLYAGRRLRLDDPVYRSERDTGHRNRAISHMLRNFGIIERDPEPDLDLYFRQCSIEVTCRDLAVMGATLATGGVNPITGERVLARSNVDEVLSVMTTCGMYDSAGEWVYRVGLPAKSGVAGGVLAVLPGQLAIAVFSPRLDARGNSVRGVAVCEALSEELELHFLRAPRPALSALRARTTVAARGSKRVRPAAERELLAAHDGEAVVYELQGELGFAGSEAVIRLLVNEPPAVGRFALDLGRVVSLDETAARLLLEAAAALAAARGPVVFSGLARHPRFARQLAEAHARDAGLRLSVVEDLDASVEACEDAIVAAHGGAGPEREELPLAEHELLRGVAGEQRELLVSLMERRSFAPRETLVRLGEPADELFLVVRGMVSVLAPRPDGRASRLTTVTAGMGFGEPSMIENSVRSAFVRAERPTVCWVLKRAAFDSIDAACPALKIRLLENLLRAATSTWSRLSFEASMGAR